MRGFIQSGDSSSHTAAIEAVDDAGTEPGIFDGTGHTTVKVTGASIDQPFEVEMSDRWAGPGEAIGFWLHLYADEPGEFIENLVIETDEDGTAPLEALVSVLVDGPPTLSVSQTEVTCVASDAEQTTSIGFANDGDGILTLNFWLEDGGADSFSFVDFENAVWVWLEVPPGDSIDVGIRCQSEEPDEQDLLVYTNDPDLPLVQIPMTVL